MDIPGRATRCVSIGKHGEGMLDDPGQGMDGALFEEDQSAGMDLTRRVVVDRDLGAAGEDVELFVATEVIVRGDGAVDAEDAAACGLLVGEADVGENGFGSCAKGGSESGAEKNP